MYYIPLILLNNKNFGRKSCGSEDGDHQRLTRRLKPVTLVREVAMATLERES